MRQYNNTGKVLTNMLDELFNNSFSDIVGASVTDTVPSANIIDNEDGYTIELAVPGMTKKDFSIDVHDNKLTIMADTSTDSKSEETTITKREFNFMKFSRSFQLSDDIDRSSISAQYINGVLAIGMKKLAPVEKETATTIKIN